MRRVTSVYMKKTGGVKEFSLFQRSDPCKVEIIEVSYSVQ
jgi:hypothetical protein